MTWNSWCGGGYEIMRLLRERHNIMVADRAALAIEDFVMALHLLSCPAQYTMLEFWTWGSVQRDLMRGLS